ncbi:uncharacterized protein N7479_001276 [Penicillium vulpinum]|uniref:uncharacterized protein n=1 Tax=Penicillium vulpinum TaxID=29845 RepID=UPI002548BE8C|nr:uncharacterized protein N7479_001276 [Penicillium vulpinum]KAJ5971358.1 hypothetical protein N7479_001276 [Penicillium vulpinum]
MTLFKRFISIHDFMLFTLITSSPHACHVFLPAMAGDDEGGLKLTYRTIQCVTNVTSPIEASPAN